jgi:hypothetical protein
MLLAVQRMPGIAPVSTREGFPQRCCRRFSDVSLRVPIALIATMRRTFGDLNKTLTCAPENRDQRALGGGKEIRTPDPLHAIDPGRARANAFELKM